MNSVLLTEIDYNEEQNLTENLVSASAETESWGGSDLGRNPEDRCDLPEALNRKEGHGSLSLKAGMHCNVSHFPIGLVITSYMQPISFIAFLLVSLVVLHPAKGRIQEQLSP